MKLMFKSNCFLLVHINLEFAMNTLVTSNIQNVKVSLLKLGFVKFKFNKILEIQCYYSLIVKAWLHCSLIILERLG